MKDYSKTRTRQYHTNVVKDPDIIFTLLKNTDNPKITGVSRDGKFRSFAYIPVGGSLEAAKRSITLEYKMKKLNV